MRKKNTAFLLAGLLLLAACGGQRETQTPTETPAGEVAQATSTMVSPTATATAVPATETPSPTETPWPTPEPVVSACVTCHEDQEMLVDTAAPVQEPEESESSGVG